MNRNSLLRSPIILATLITSSLLADDSEKKFITIEDKANVRVPGKIAWTDGMTLSAAISAAGGSSFEPRLCIVRGAERFGPYSTRNKRQLKTSDPKLLPGDTITAWEPPK
jgi:hypothetical protein